MGYSHGHAVRPRERGGGGGVAVEVCVGEREEEEEEEETQQQLLHVKWQGSSRQRPSRRYCPASTAPTSPSSTFRISLGERGCVAAVRRECGCVMIM